MTVLVDSGAFQMAINVLRRAGKTEIADELEKGSVRISTSTVGNVTEAIGTAMSCLANIRKSHPEAIADSMPASWGMKRLQLVFPAELVGSTELPPENLPVETNIGLAFYQNGCWFKKGARLALRDQSSITGWKLTTS